MSGHHLGPDRPRVGDRKSTRLNSSHSQISYAVFCLKKKPGLSWIPTGMGYQFYFGGTSLLILVGVAMDTVAQIEAQLVMRNYEGVLGGGGRLRGRRA